jgi:protein TonB
MAREGLRSHLSGSVPISIVAHLVVLLVLVVIPLTDIVLPSPLREMRSFVRAEALPVPPAPEPRPVSAPRTANPAPSHPVAPVTAPDRIEPEAPAAPPSIATDTDVPGGIGIGDPAGIGTLATPAPLPPPDPPKPQGPVRVAELPAVPRKIVDVRPVYPDLARTVQKEGMVILEAVIDTSGRVTQLRVIRSEPLLDQAALDAVRQWRYAPSIYYGKPVSVLMTITVRFTLQR